MNQFNNGKLIQLLDTLPGMFALCQQRNDGVIDGDWIAVAFDRTAAELNALGLSSRATDYENYAKLIRECAECFSPDGHSQRLETMRGSVISDMEQWLFFAVPAERAEFFNRAASEPEADMRSALKCYAFEQPTACAFHLMRLFEPWVRAFAVVIGHTEDRLEWGNVNRHFDSRWRNASNRVDPIKWISHGTQLCRIDDLIGVVKEVWRNNTMHCERTYTMEDARSLLTFVPNLIRESGTVFDLNGDLL